MAESPKTPASKAKATPKAPQDRKPKAVEEVAPLPEDTPGWHLLKPFAQIPVWDQAPIVALAETLTGGRAEGEEIEISTSGMLATIGELAKALLTIAVDEEEYTKFVSGRDGLQNAANLAMAWVSQLGESVASES